MPSGRRPTVHLAYMSFRKREGEFGAYLGGLLNVLIILVFKNDRETVKCKDNLIF